MMNNSTIEALKAMRFSAMAAEFERQLDDPAAYRSFIVNSLYVLIGKFHFFQFSKLEIVIQKVFNNPVELMFYQSKVKCYLFAYKWQPFTWSLTIPIACI